MALVWWFLTGLVAGAVARLLVPGPSNLGCIGTSVLGILGSLVGGTLISLLSGDGLEVQTSNFFGAVGGAIVLLVLGRLIGGGRGRPRRFEDDLDVRRR